MAKTSKRIAPNVIVLMTALPVTNGHINLINFAERFRCTIQGSITHVLLNSRSCEPIPGVDRESALRRHFYRNDLIHITHAADDNVPQNPMEHPDFWNFWKDYIKAKLPKGSVQKGDYIVASEEYGIKLAEVLECKFVPYDHKREINPVTGTDVRKHFLQHWNDLPSETKKPFRKRITIFGAESCGKTTMAKRLARDIEGGGIFIPEWARGYLEMVGPEVTADKMTMIMQGQYALQESVRYDSDKPFVIQDTDLYSTLGYYDICGIPKPSVLWSHLEYSKAHLYIVMNSNIPFEQDPLRYGGDKRESTDEFWIDILKQNKCNYHVVTNTDHELQYQEIQSVILDMFNSQFTDLAAFTRT